MYDLNCKKLLEGEVKHFNNFKNSDFHLKFPTLNLNVTPRNKQNCPQKQKNHFSVRLEHLIKIPLLFCNVFSVKTYNLVLEWVKIHNSMLTKVHDNFFSSKNDTNKELVEVFW